MSLTPREIEEIEAVALKLESFSSGSYLAARLRALLPPPESLEEVCEDILSGSTDGSGYLSKFGARRLRAALERRRKEQGK